MRDNFVFSMRKLLPLKDDSESKFWFRVNPANSVELEGSMENLEIITYWLTSTSHKCAAHCCFLRVEFQRKTHPRIIYYLEIIILEKTHFSRNYLLLRETNFRSLLFIIFMFYLHFIFIFSFSQQCINYLTYSVADRV